MDGNHSTNPFEDDGLREIALGFRDLEDFFARFEMDSQETGLLLGAYAPSSMSTPGTGASFADSAFLPQLAPDEGSPFTLTPGPMTPSNAGDTMGIITAPGPSDFPQFNLELSPGSPPCNLPQIILTPEYVHPGLAHTPPVASSSSSRLEDQLPGQFYEPPTPQSHPELSPLSLLSPLSTASFVSPWSSPLASSSSFRLEDQLSRQFYRSPTPQSHFEFSPLSLLSPLSTASFVSPRLSPLPLSPGLPTPVRSPSYEDGFMNPSLMQAPSPMLTRRQSSLDDSHIPAIRKSKRKAVNCEQDSEYQAPRRMSKRRKIVPYSDPGHGDVHEARQTRSSQKPPEAPEQLGPQVASESTKSESDGPAQCERCDTKLTRKSDLKRHLKYQCNADPLIYLCLHPKCVGRTFSRPDSVMRHCRTMHKGQPAETDEIRASQLPARPEKKKEQETQTNTKTQTKMQTKTKNKTQAKTKKPPQKKGPKKDPRK